MLTKIYRAIMLAQASSAANRTAAYLSDHQLNDWGYTRGSFTAAMVAQVKADFDAADKAQAASAGFQPVTFSQLPAQAAHCRSQAHHTEKPCRTIVRASVCRGKYETSYIYQRLPSQKL